MNVEDIASQIGVIFGMQHDWRDQISGVHVSLGKAETLATGDDVLTQQHHSQKISEIGWCAWKL